MRERKYVKFRVDMYEDTKFKIIDMKPERDVIHYIWNRIVLLAGKVNLEGDLFLSKNLPYTIETLAIEFNRDIALVKLALELFIELEMIELTEDNVYRVKNFVKHQNIKVKQKVICNNGKAEVKTIDVQLNEACDSKVDTMKPEEKDNKALDNKFENKMKTEGDSDAENLKIGSKDLLTVNDSEVCNNSDAIREYNSVIQESKKRKMGRKKKKSSNFNTETFDEIFTDDTIGCVYDGERPLGKDEIIVSQWTFG